MSDGAETFSERVARLRRERLAAEPTYAPDLVPEIAPTELPDDGLDEILSGVTIVDAYTRWCGKMQPKVGSKHESIMVSCPNPDHPDANPSAWLNSDKDVGNCALCGGFDVFDVYAWNHGYPVPGYKLNGTFPELRRDIARALGHQIRTTLGGQDVVEPVLVEPARDGTGVDVTQPPESRSQPSDDGPALAPVIRIADDEPSNLDALLFRVPPIEWQELLGDDSTFLRPWLDVCSGDDLPDEFYFWLGLVALGFTVGNNVTLADWPPVRANLLVCLVGASGMGKSRAVGMLNRLLHEALPYDTSSSGGVNIIGLPGSAESLIDEFNMPIYGDPSDPRLITGYAPVRGLLNMSELAELMGKAARVGNTMKPTMMDFYDSSRPIQVRSRTHGLVRAQGHFFQSVSSTQPAILHSILTVNDDLSGFLNRWTWVVGQSKPPRSRALAPPDISPLVGTIRAARAWGGAVRMLELEPEADKRWDEFFHTRLVKLKATPDTAAFGRVDLLFKKLILLLAIDKQERIVSRGTVEQALSLFDYIHAVYTFGGESIAADAASECGGLLVSVAKQHLAETGLLPTMRDIQRRRQQQFKRFGNKLIVDTMKLLIAMGELEEVLVKPALGRPTTRYRVPGGETD